MVKPALIKVLGVLFRIKLLQSWLAISILLWNVFYLLLNINPDFTLENLISNLPLSSSIILIVASVFYLALRKWFVIPAILLTALVFQIAIGISCPWLNSVWIIQLMIMIVYPYYYYKYLHFENMLHVLRIAVGVLLIAATWQGQLPVSGNFNWIYADTALIGVLPTGILLTFWKYTRNMAGILLGISMGYIFGVAVTNELWNWIFWSAYISVMLVLLFADNREEDLIAFEWTRSYYYRFILLIIFLIPFFQNKIIKSSYQASSDSNQTDLLHS